MQLTLFPRVLPCLFDGLLIYHVKLKIQLQLHIKITACITVMAGDASVLDPCFLNFPCHFMEILIEHQHSC